MGDKALGALLTGLKMHQLMNKRKTDLEDMKTVLDNVEKLKLLKNLRDLRNAINNHSITKEEVDDYLKNGEKSNLFNFFK